MNKLFTKIVGAALGLTMAIGVGVAVGSNSKEATPVHATEATAYTMSISKDAGNSNYAASKDASITSNAQTITWNIPGNQTLGDYTKLGGKLSSETTRSIYSKGTISQNITRIVVSTGNKDNQITVTSMTVTAHSTAANAAAGSSPVSTFDFTYAANSSPSASKTGSTDLSGKYWRFNLTMTSSASSKNYGAIINSITFYSAKTLSSISLGGTYDTEFTVGDTFSHTEMVVTATYSDESTADVSSSATWSSPDMSTAGQKTVTVSYTEGVTKTADYPITVSAPTTPYITPAKNSTSGYTGQNESLSFTYGNLTGSLSVTSSNTSVVTVGTPSYSAGSGTVQLNFAGAGSTTVKFLEGSTERASVDVSVTASSVSITGLAATSTAYIGKTLDLGSTITVTATGIYTNAVTWESDDASIATVNPSTGVVTGVKEGTVDITVTSDVYPSATMTCSVTVSAAPLVYEFTFGSSYNSSPGSIATDAALKTAYSAFTTYGISGSSFSQIYGSSSYNLKLGSNNNPASVTFTIPSDQYITKVVIGTGTTVASVNLRIVSGATGATQESQAISTSSTFMFDDYLATEKSNVFTMSTSAKGAVAIASMDIYYASKTPELHASSTGVEAVINTSTASVDLTYDNFTPTSYSEVITGSSVSSVAYNTASTPHTATFTTSATTGESTIVITGTGGGKNASVTITVNVTNPRNVTALTITTASDATTFKVGETFDVGSLVITATFDAAPTTVVYSKANGNIGNLVSEPAIGYQFVEADIGHITSVIFELEFGTGDEYCDYDINVVDKDYAAPVTNLDSLWDGQKVYFSNGSDAAFPKYSAGNNVSSVSATIHETKGLDIASTTAYAYTVHRMKVDSIVYYLFSVEESGTTYYIKDAGTASSNAITKVSDISDTAIYWTLSAGANEGQWVITNRSNTAKANLQVNGTYLSCYNGGQKNPYLYAVTSYSESAVASDFAAGAMHMSESTSGQCVDYYPIAKQVWNAMSDDEKLNVDEEQPLAYARLVAWAAYHGETINGSYNIVSASRISILNTTIGKNGNTVAIIVVISMISVTCIGGYFFLRRRKEN